jgi:hypothetical protein
LAGAKKRLSVIHITCAHVEVRLDPVKKLVRQGLSHELDRITQIVRNRIRRRPVYGTPVERPYELGRQMRRSFPAWVWVLIAAGACFVGAWLLDASAHGF